MLAQRGRPTTAQPEPPSPLYAWDFDFDWRERKGALASYPVGAPRVEGGALVIADANSYVETDLLPVEIGGKTLEVVVQLSDLGQRGGAAISLQTPDGAVFDSVVFGEREPQRWMAGSNDFQRSQKFGGPAENDALQRPVHIAIVYRGDGTIERYRDGRPYGEAYKTSLQSFKAGKAVLRFGVRRLPVGGNVHLRGRIFRAALYNRALTLEEIAAAAALEKSYVSNQETLTVLDQRARTLRQRLVHERDATHDRLSTVDASVQAIYTVRPKESPGLTKFLHRGNAMDEGEVVTPGATSAVRGVAADFDLAADANDAERRVRLAGWITSDKNPLFPRVIANRLWHHHFGTGIVETPNDFGFNGGRPSHPELLDWLASEIAAQGWSLKKMHHLIVNSATYRQSSRPDPKAILADADNRWLWRKSPIRLDAESLRDTMVAVSGRLNRKLYGPGFRDVKVAHHQGTTYYTPFDEENPEIHRRTVYRFSPRGGRSTILDTFDCPDPSTTAPRRSVTTTPMQALALLNNSFSLRIQDHFAGRIVEETGEDRSAQVDRAYRVAFGRRPDEEELQIATDFVSAHGMKALACVLLNSNEFVIAE